MDQAKLVLVGRLSRDPEFAGEGDVQRAMFSIATNRGRGEKRKSSFFDCIAWGKRADIMRDFSKGKRDTVIVTQNGEAKAVLQDIITFEKTQETLLTLYPRLYLQHKGSLLVSGK